MSHNSLISPLSHLNLHVPKHLPFISVFLRPQVPLQDWHAHLGAGEEASVQVREPSVPAEAARAQHPSYVPQPRVPTHGRPLTSSLLKDTSTQDGDTCDSSFRTPCRSHSCLGTCWRRRRRMILCFPEFCGVPVTLKPCAVYRCWCVPRLAAGGHNISVINIGSSYQFTAGQTFPIIFTPVSTPSPYFIFAYSSSRFRSHSACSCFLSSFPGLPFCLSFIILRWSHLYSIP